MHASQNVSKSLICVFSIIIATSMGCEQIEKIKNKITGKQEQPSAAKQQAVDRGAQSKPIASNVLARVGDWTITRQEFEERLTALKEVVPEYDVNDPESRRLVLDELVRQQLLVIDAEKKGAADNKDIVAAVEEFRRTLIVREVASRLTEGITVTEEEARQFYEEQKDILREPVQWRVSEIVVETQIKANEILLEALKGTDFSQLAREHSVAESASQGGDLGYLEEEPFPAMVDALLALEEGEVSGVFKGPEGFYIVKLTEVTGGEQIPYEEIKEDIIQNRTLIKQQQAILDHIEKLEEQIKVEINEDLLK